MLTIRLTDRVEEWTLSAPTDAVEILSDESEDLVDAAVRLSLIRRGGADEA